MAHNVIRAVLASALATSGTLAVTYPSGFGKGDYILGTDHRLVALQAEMKVGNGFTISFGDTQATITYNGTTTIPAGSEIYLQLDRSGGKWCPENVLKRATPVQTYLVELGSPATADADGICASQSVTASVEALLDGALADTTNDFITLDRPRNVVAAWTGTAVATVTGRDEYGETMVEKSASGTSLTGKKAFKYVDSVTFSANVTSATVGTGDVLGLPFFLRDNDQVLAEYENSIQVSNGAGIELMPWQYGATQINAGTSWALVSSVYGNITRLRSAVEIAFTTGGDVTVEVDTVAVDGLSMAVGTEALLTLDTDVPTANHATTRVTPGSLIEIIGSSAFDSAGSLNGVLEIRKDAVQNGVAVVGSQAAATATSGDVRGTYDPTTACDGVTSFALLVVIDNPNYLGPNQYAG